MDERYPSGTQMDTVSLLCCLVILFGIHKLDYFGCSNSFTRSNDWKRCTFSILP